MHMKKYYGKIFAGTVCIAIVGLIIIYLNIPEKEYRTVSYEFEKAPGINVTMEIEEIEGLQYQIEPYEDLVVSEPSPDWGIMVYFGEEPDFLYFYTSLSPGGINIFMDEEVEHDFLEINGKRLELAEEGDHIVGSCRISSGYFGVIINMEKSQWEANKETVIRLIQSAEIKQ